MVHLKAWTHTTDIMVRLTLLRTMVCLKACITLVFPRLLGVAVTLSKPILSPDMVSRHRHKACRALHLTCPSARHPLLSSHPHQP